MDTQSHGGLEDDVPFLLGHFQVPMLIFQGVIFFDPQDARQT